MLPKLLVAVVVEALDGRILDGAVHPLDLTVGPGMVDAREAEIAALRMALAEREAALAERDARLLNASLEIEIEKLKVQLAAFYALAEDWDALKDELGGSAKLSERDGRPRIIDMLVAGPLTQQDVRDRAFIWLAERVNTFVNVLRPRVRSTVADYLARAQ